MKTKIIYISGSEIFDVADIRSAFDEVRSALGFGLDTVLFGVPVDSDDIGLEKIKKPSELKNTVVTEEIIETESEEDVSEEVVIKPAPLKKKTTKIELESETKPEPEQRYPKVSEKIIPILSVLSGKSDSENNEDEQNSNSQESIEIESVVSETVTLKDKNFIDEEEVVTTKTFTIEEMMNDDVPDVEQEETLEQLFARITPLREDTNTEEINITSMENINTDTTLEQLANEFSEKENDIISTPKIESSGKIGKLKNILPFKKAKREEPGLMGDLFGWAGIAANDEEFSIPGFFTTSASKK
ncbi:MAG: hypothetical protein JW974_01360 [Alphaproteobacteria bacterium]|nr:hypothetical protein [Alphaproteobacteria bacterium]MBN2675431.1 hypothetical protein [Alphaproteobacteria bacterium]